MTTPIESSLRDALSTQYEIDREIGRGGMGVVYLARDVRLDRPVAIKILSPHLSGDAELRERFLREARTAARLSHPNIVSIYSEGEADGRPFIVMQYVHGESVAEKVRDSGAVGIANGAAWLRDVALALGYAHSLGVVHRDIKPENILIDASYQKAMIADFGIARVNEASRLTATGQVLGSVHFMSPEQVTNGPLDGRSDLYSLGAVAFFMLTGRLPFPSDAVGAVLVAHVNTPAPRLRDVAPEIPAALATIVDRCLRKDPAKRYQTGEELAAALDSAMTGVVESDSTIIGEADAALLWKRASELQADAVARGAISGESPTGAVPLLPRRIASEGYKLGDAKAAAVEAGISQKYVALALGEIRAAKSAPPQSAAVIVADKPHSIIAGAPTQLEREVTIDGEVTPDEFGLLVDTIQRSFGELGQVGTLGRSLVWTSQGSQRKIHVSVIPRQGRTTIRVTESQRHLAGGLYGGIVGGFGGGFGAPSLAIGINVFHSVPLALGMMAGTVAVAYGVARTIFVGVTKRRVGGIDRLIATLKAQIEDSVRN
ncbi:MAG: serine/threonine-protein kinase [Gemmatimonadaceae bacterium]